MNTKYTIYGKPRQNVQFVQIMAFKVLTSGLLDEVYIYIYILYYKNIYLYIYKYIFNLSYLF